MRQRREISPGIVEEDEFMLAVYDTAAAIDEATALIDYNRREPPFRILKGIYTRRSGTTTPRSHTISRRRN